MVRILAILFAIMLCFAGSSYADEPLTLTNARVLKVGLYDNVRSVWVIDSSMTSSMSFILPNDNSYLAVVLMAFEGNHSIWIRTSGGHGSRIVGIFLNK